MRSPATCTPTSKFRFRGSTDEETDALRDAVLQALAGQREVDLQRLGPECWPGSCR